MPIAAVDGPSAAGKGHDLRALAEALGNVVAARWIGHFLLHHAHDPACVCHRVVRAGGRIGPYVEGGTLAKQRRLKAEAVEIRGETVDLARYGQDRFRSDRPLERLRRLQEALAAKVSLRPPRRMPKIVAGLDVSYPRPDEGVAAYALVDLDAGQLLWSKTVRRPVRFPYITSDSTFRELPILMDLLDEVRAAGRMAPVLPVDGSGILHPCARPASPRILESSHQRPPSA